MTTLPNCADLAQRAFRLARRMTGDDAAAAQLAAGVMVAARDLVYNYYGTWDQIPTPVAHWLHDLSWQALQLTEQHPS